MPDLARLRQSPAARLIRGVLFIVLLAGAPAVAAQSGTPEPEVVTNVGGISLSLDPIPGQRRYKRRDDVYQVAPGTTLKADLGFVQWFSEPIHLRLFLLLNYEQTDFALRQDLSVEEGEIASPGEAIPIVDPGQMRHVQEFMAPPEEEFHFALETGPLAAGFYDLALIVVPEPEKNQRELPYWAVRQFSDRATVYVGDDARPPTIAFPLVDSEPGAAAGLSELIWFGHEPHKAGVKGAQQVIAGQSVTLTVNYQPYSRRKAGENPLPVAFVAILEDRVVPLNGQPVFYGSVLPHRLSYLPITIRVPDAPGLYQLFVQPFPHPYVDAREAVRTRRDLYAISSQRFILDAR